MPIPFSTTFGTLPKGEMLRFNSSGGVDGPDTVEPLKSTAKAEAEALFSTVDRVLSEVYYVPAIRGFDSPEYPLGDDFILDLQAGENAQQATNFVYAGKDIEEIVSIWCKNITGSGVGAEVIPGKKVVVDSDGARGGIPVICDGFGTNQLVNVLLTLAITPKRSIVAIEEPEIHLHPKAQENLCRILLEVAKNENKQLIITTHSERILWSFVSAVRNRELTRDELALYYFASKGEEPQRIEQDEYGDIYEWGRGFFA